MKLDKGLPSIKAGVASYTDFGRRTSKSKKVKLSRYRPGKTQRVPGG
jgi:hypothetical protein